jgi:hypothetical protein
MLREAARVVEGRRLRLGRPREERLAAAQSESQSIASIAEGSAASDAPSRLQS